MPNHQKSPKFRPSRHRKFPELRRGGVTPHEVRRQHQSLAFAYGLRPAPARPRICPPAPGILVDRVEGQRAHAPLAGAQLPDRLPTRPALPGRAKFRRQQEPPSRRSTCQLGDREAGSPGRRTGRSARSAPRRARRSPRRVIGDQDAYTPERLSRCVTMAGHGSSARSADLSPASADRRGGPCCTRMIVLCVTGAGLAEPTRHERRCLVATVPKAARPRGVRSPLAGSERARWA